MLWTARSIPFSPSSLPYLVPVQKWNERTSNTDSTQERKKYIAEGGKVGRKAGWTISDEILQEQYASAIKQLKKGYPIRLVAKSERVGVSTVQRMKKKFVDNVA